MSADTEQAAAPQAEQPTQSVATRVAIKMTSVRAMCTIVLVATLCFCFAYLTRSLVAALVLPEVPVDIRNTLLQKWDMVFQAVNSLTSAFAGAYIAKQREEGKTA